MISPDVMARFQHALPFWVSLMLLPLLAFVTVQGGWWIALLPLSTWWLFAVLDQVVGLELENADLGTTDKQLRWHRLITLIWPPLQFIAIFGVIYYLSRANDVSWGEIAGLSFALGVLSGTIGITYAHELFLKLYQRRMLLRLIGVKLSGLIHGHQQIDLFRDDIKMIKLYEAMDRMKHRFENPTLIRRAVGFSSYEES